MELARMLAYVTRTVDQELLLQNEYLAAENRILKAQLKGRLTLSDNAAMESFFSSLKTERTERKMYRTRDEAILVNYGEITADSLSKNGLKVGMRVSAGQPIGWVSDTSMLHFETYVKGATPSHRWWKTEKNPPRELLNPRATYYSWPNAACLTSPIGVGLDKPNLTRKEGDMPVTRKTEDLDLVDYAKASADLLLEKHPTVKFTSGRRNVAQQASAMAGNVTVNRKWIQKTYTDTPQRKALQKWVDDHPDAKTKAVIAAGLESVMTTWSDLQKSRLSRHFSGQAFDVQPVDGDAGKAIKKTIRALPNLRQFLEKEGGLVRWHADFEKK